MTATQASGRAAPALIRNAMQSVVASRYVPGVVTALWETGSLDVEAVGRRSFDGPPMTRDTIFRMASTTKLVTAAAAMVLVDDGVIGLDDPVDRLLPELADRKVLRAMDGPVEDVVPAERPISLRDLLTLRMGLGTIMPYPSGYPIQKAMDERQIFRPFAPFESTPDEYLKRLGELPLAAQPGRQWLYHIGIDVAGVLIARASGRSLSDFMQERIFEPLGMHDTGFFVPEAKRARLAPFYQSERPGGNAVPFHEDWARYDRVPVFESGAGGLASTADDFMAFCLMLLDEGEAGGRRIVAAASVREMMRNQLSSEQLRGPQVDPFLEHSSGWGLGGAVALRRTKPWLTPGRYGWDGGFGVQAYVDPAERKVGILLSQRLVDSPSWPPTYTAFWKAAYP